MGKPEGTDLDRDEGAFRDRNLTLPARAWRGCVCRRVQEALAVTAAMEENVRTSRSPRDDLTRANSFTCGETEAPQAGMTGLLLRCLYEKGKADSQAQAHLVVTPAAAE